MTNEQKILIEVLKANPDNPLQYVRNIVKNYSLEKLNQQIINCKDCSICNQYKSIGHGNANASILVIGGYPLKEYKKNTKAFYEKEEIKNIIDKTFFDICKINKEEIYFANVIQCFPYQLINNKREMRIPIKKEIDNCFVFLNHLIEIIQPLVIILLGPIALNVFNKEKNIIKNHGEWISVKGIPTIFTYHPEYFIQMKDKKDEELLNMQKYEFIEDIQKAILYIEEKYPMIKIYN